jgi:hypothetical protein
VQCVIDLTTIAPSSATRRPWLCEARRDSAGRISSDEGESATVRTTRRSAKANAGQRREAQYWSISARNSMLQGISCTTHERVVAERRFVHCRCCFHRTLHSSRPVRCTSSERGIAGRIRSRASNRRRSRRALEILTVARWRSRMHSVCMVFPGFPSSALLVLRLQLARSAGCPAVPPTAAASNVRGAMASGEGQIAAAYSGRQTTRGRRQTYRRQTGSCCVAQQAEENSGRPSKYHARKASLQSERRI